MGERHALFMYEVGCGWAAQCVFLTKFLQVFNIRHTTTCTKVNCMLIDTHNLDIDMYYDLWRQKSLINLHFKHQNDTYYQAYDIEVTFYTRMWMSIDILFLKIYWKLNVKRNLSNMHTDWATCSELYVEGVVCLLSTMFQIPTPSLLWIVLW